jgi:hypothetical protein
MAAKARITRMSKARFASWASFASCGLTIVKSFAG